MRVFVGTPRRAVNANTLGPATTAMPLPELPPDWRDDVVSMLFDFLEDAGLAHTLVALETETGCVSRQRFQSHRGDAQPRRPAAPRPANTSSLTPHAPHLDRRRRGERVERLGEELAFLRALVLRGDWDAAETFLEPVADHPGVDHRTLRAHIRRQAFLETFAGPDLGDPDAAPDPDPDVLVAALRELKPSCATNPNSTTSASS